MRLLVVGAGSTGGYFGGRLAQAGRDVTFLVRPARAAKLRQSGLRIVSPHGDATLQPKIVTRETLAGTYDAVLLTVKAYQLEAAMEDFAPAVGPETMILPVLNGMRHMELLAQRFSPHNVVGCAVKVSTTLDDDGRVVQLSTMQEHRLWRTRRRADAAHGGAGRIHAVGADRRAAFARDPTRDVGEVDLPRVAGRDQLPDARNDRRDRGLSGRSGVCVATARRSRRHRRRGRRCAVGRLPRRRAGDADRKGIAVWRLRCSATCRAASRPRPRRSSAISSAAARRPAINAPLLSAAYVCLSSIRTGSARLSR